jgi:hypothetical protein
MNVEIGTEAVQFPEKENINGIFVAVQGAHGQQRDLTKGSEGAEQLPDQAFSLVFVWFTE